ncbi:MAG: Rid family hydrolase, partial [Spongiibacteraceae bacterium]
RPSKHQISPKPLNMNEVLPLLTLLDAIPPSQLRDLAENRVLGVQQIGQKPADNHCPAPTQTLSMPIFHADANLLCDVWLANAPCQIEQFDGVRICYNDQVLFGVIEIDEAKFALRDANSVLRAATDKAYQQIFNALNAKNYPHLWRAWNYIPDIHDAETGLERYRQFNIGRHQAFESTRRAVDSSPAASALGTRGGLFSVAFIAGRTAPIRIENPRQISAYAYPSRYGPRSPAFSRAVTVTDATHCMLFVSGTASIVGHETVHSGDVVAQTREAVANVSALLEQVNTATMPPIPLKDLTYRVYIRHPHHHPLVRAALDASLNAPAHALYVQADICRTDLLVEIEAFAVAPLTAQKP